VSRQTKMWNLYNEELQQHNNYTNELKEAVAALQAGEQIAFPTETVYGLGADARVTDAVKGIFEAKGRPADNPLIVHIATKAQMEEFVLPYHPLADRLMDAFWPGPLSIILPVRAEVLSPLVTAGLPTVGVRMPDHPIALALIAQSGCPLAVPSANRSGRPSPTLADHVYQDLQGKIAGIIDGGATGVGLESTVVEIVDDTCIRILRPGGITIQMLQQLLPTVNVISETELESKEAPRSPGMKYTHYAPQGQLTLVRGEQALVEPYIKNELKAVSAQQLSVGILAFDEHVASYANEDNVIVLSLGSIDRLEEAAAKLYAALRQFDELAIEYIWSETCVPIGIGEALMNRLLKAAGYRMIDLI